MPGEPRHFAAFTCPAPFGPEQTQKSPGAPRDFSVGSGIFSLYELSNGYHLAVTAEAQPFHDMARVPAAGADVRSLEIAAILSAKIDMILLVDAAAADRRAVLFFDA